MKIITLMLILLLCVSAVGCSLGGEESNAESEFVSIYVPSASKTPSENEVSDVTSDTSSTADVSSVFSQIESSYEQSDASSAEDSSEEPQNTAVGKLFEPYYKALQSGNYMQKTVETRQVGGEAAPYITTVYRNGDDAYIIKEESYGAISEILIKDGYTYWFDKIAKTATRIQGTESLEAQRTLYEGEIQFVRDDVYKTFDDTYKCEVYSHGGEGEIWFCFNELNELKTYRFYDAEKKDVITIGIEISLGTDGISFSLPDGYEVIG